MAGTLKAISGGPNQPPISSTSSPESSRLGLLYAAAIRTARAQAAGRDATLECADVQVAHPGLIKQRKGYPKMFSIQSALKPCLQISVNACRRMSLLFVALPLALAACGGSEKVLAPNVARIANGLVEGTQNSDHVVFKGMPFAAAPVGPLRWRAPQPVADWSGVRDASRFGNDCMQEKSPFGNPTTVPSEDCLYLNVYKPLAAKPGDKLPVHVWIHGGAFAFGAGSQPLFDTAADVRSGIVYVTINYRLNVFGFMSHPALTAEAGGKGSGNYGLMDQIAALKWVQQNIANFGGDPEAVTVSGESAGAASIGYLLISPQSKGLFKRVIMGSTFGFHPQRSLAEAESWAAQRVGNDLVAMRAISAEQLFAKAGAGEGLATNAGIFGYEDWVPSIDGVVLPKVDRQAWKAGDFATIEMLIGDNENEGFLFMTSNSRLPAAERTADKYRNFLRAEYGALGEQAVASYPVGSDAEVMYQLSLAYGDSWFKSATRSMSRYMVTRTPNVYRYLFTKHSASSFMTNGRPVATHTDELAYMFGAVVEGAKYNASDVATSAAMQEAKRRFIKTGNPNGGTGMPAWPAYDATDPYMEFGDAGQVVGAGHRNGQLDLVQQYLATNLPLN
jgi:para-nitrobenzyl esterase